MSDMRAALCSILMGQRFASLMKRISDAYLRMLPNQRNAPFSFERNQLDETVPAVLMGLPHQNI